MNTKTSKLFKGVLENAGLGEVAFYLKKAKQNLSYATYAMEDLDFSDASSKSRKVRDKVTALQNTILELDVEIENLALELEAELEKKNESEGN